MRNSLISTGFIGFRNHAERIRAIVEQSGKTSTQVVFHPEKTISHYKASNTLEALRNCDVVFILSPNATHFGYLKYFSEAYSGYIYCEKPPVSTHEELAKLRALPLNPEKVFFNFQLRFSRLREVLEHSLKDGSLGAPLNCSISVTQGLAYKEHYAESWRADIKQHPHGVAETKAIHYIDLLSLLFGQPIEFKYHPSNRSGHGTAYDTCHLSLAFENGLIANLIMSYAAPLTFEFNFLGTNGQLEYRNDCLTLKTPRDSFNQHGYFSTPPETVRIDYQTTSKDLTQESHERSLDYFLTHCESNNTFEKQLFEQSLATNCFILDLDN